MKTSQTLLALTTSLMMLSGGTSIAIAQGNTVPAQPEISMDAAGITGEQLDVFVEAYVQVNQIGAAYDGPMQAAESDDERNALRVQAQREMVDAVDALDGITVEEFNQIMVVAQSDPAVGDRVRKRIELLQQ